MIRRVFGLRQLYIKVSENRFEITDLSGNAGTRVFQAGEAFTTTRLLIGRFSAAEHCLADAVERMVGGRWLRPEIEALIQPLAMSEGGLSEVEARVLREVAVGAGAHYVAVRVGEILPDEQARKAIRMST